MEVPDGGGHDIDAFAGLQLQGDPKTYVAFVGGSRDGDWVGYPSNRESAERLATAYELVRHDQDDALPDDYTATDDVLALYGDAAHDAPVVDAVTLRDAQAPDAEGGPSLRPIADLTVDGAEYRTGGSLGMLAGILSGADLAAEMSDEGRTAFDPRTQFPRQNTYFRAHPIDDHIVTMVDHDVPPVRTSPPQGDTADYRAVTVTVPRADDVAAITDHAMDHQLDQYADRFIQQQFQQKTGGRLPAEEIDEESRAQAREHIREHNQDGIRTELERILMTTRVADDGEDRYLIHRDAQRQSLELEYHRHRDLPTHVHPELHGAGAAATPDRLDDVSLLDTLLAAGDQPQNIYVDTIAPSERGRLIDRGQLGDDAAVTAEAVPRQVQVDRGGRRYTLPARFATALLTNPNTETVDLHHDTDEEAGTTIYDDLFDQQEPATTPEEREEEASRTFM